MKKKIHKIAVFLAFTPFVFLGAIASAIYFHIGIGWYFNGLHLTELYEED